MILIPNWFKMIADIKLYASLNISGLTFEGNSQIQTADLHDMRAWIFSQLAWDASRDGDELVNEYLVNYYSEGAAGYILQHMRAYTAEVIQIDYYVTASDGATAPYFAPHVIYASLTALSNALDNCSAAGDALPRSKVLSEIRALRVSPWFLALSNWPALCNWTTTHGLVWPLEASRHASLASFEGNVTSVLGPRTLATEVAVLAAMKSGRDLTCGVQDSAMLKTDDFLTGDDDSSSVSGADTQAQPPPSSLRTVIPFGAGWRFHWGEVPDATPSRPSTMGDFERRDNVSCSGLRWNQHINMGRGGDCAKSCAYEPSCMAFELSEGWPNCHHGSSSRAWSCKPGGVTTVFTRTNVSALQHNYSFARPTFRDDSWEHVTVPHDFSINRTFSQDNCVFPSENEIDGYKAYLPRNESWYRKKFALPQEFRGRTVYLDFEGSYQFTEIYLNGEFVQSHRSGYTGLTVRLDNATLNYGCEAPNLLAVHVDPSFGSEWWYSDGGLYRPVTLVAVSPVHFVVNGVFANPQSDGASISVSAEIEDLSRGAATPKQVHFNLADETGRVVATNVTTIVRQGSVVLTPATLLSTWSPHTPTTYSVTASIEGHDEVTVRTAARLLEWKERAHINGKPIMLKGFSHHNSFGGFGIVTPARLELFQVQSARALGANFMRNSHNSYRDDLYEIMSEVGMMSWDEARLFADEYLGDFHDQVKQHRGHASVAIWAFCNEVSCNMAGAEEAALYQGIAKGLDPDRATSGNLLMNTDKCNSPLIQHMDIIGTSYGTEGAYESCHRLHPNVSLVVSEDQTGNQVLRNVAQVVPIARSNDKKQALLPFMMGWIGSWTLFDYFGEARTPVSGGRRPWPQVSSRFGAFDLAGVPKPQAYVYRANWVYDSSSFLSELEAPLSTVTSANVLVRAISTVQAVASTPQVELFIDGKSAGVRNTTEGIANFGTKAVVAAIVTAVGLDSAGNRSSSHQLMSSVKPVSNWSIHIDVPSKTTGTGEALFMDGQDIALLRVQFMDEDGISVIDDERNVTWSESGPIRITGVSSGNNANPYQQHIQGRGYETFLGLGRVLVQPTVDCTSHNRGLARQIGATVSPTLKYADTCPTEPAVVTASVQGLSESSVAVLYTGDPSDHPLAVARANRELSYTYMNDDYPAPTKTDDTELSPRVYPATDAHAPGCGPAQDNCRRIRFVVQGGGSAAHASLVLIASSPQAQVSASVNGYSSQFVNASRHMLQLRRGVNTILYSISSPALIQHLRIDHHQADEVDDAADFVTYEAEDATCTGTVIGREATELQTSTTAELTPLTSTIASESSQRKACLLTKASQFVELTLTKPGNWLSVRSSIPNGTVAELRVIPSAGESPFSLALSTNYSWSYTSGVGIPGHQNKEGHAHRFYDQVSAVLLPQSDSRRLLPAGTKVRLSRSSASAAVPITIDLVDVFDVTAPFLKPADFVSVVDHGADPTGARDSWQAFTRAVSLANSTGSGGIWIPSGSFLCNRTVVMPSNVVVRGSGPFTSVIYKNSFIGHNALNVSIFDLSIDLQRSKRGGPAGLEGSFGGGSLFQNLRIAHTGVCIGFIVGNDELGTAVGSPHHDIHWVGVSGHNSYAGGIVHRGFSGVTVESCHIRYTGDDGIAFWSGDNEANVNHDCCARKNHISLNIGGCGISIYGGDNLSLANNTIVDATTAINICSGRFSPDQLGNLCVIDNAITRATIGLGFETTAAASWNRTNVTVQNLTIRDSLASAIEFAGNVSKGFKFEHRIPSATNESDDFNAVGFEGISLTDIAIQSAELFGLVLGGTGRASFTRVTAEHLKFGGTYYCPDSCGSFVLAQVGSAWVKETGCTFPPNKTHETAGCHTPLKLDVK